MDDQRMVELFWQRDERVIDLVRETYGKLGRVERDSAR